MYLGSVLIDILVLHVASITRPKIARKLLLTLSTDMDLRQVSVQTTGNAAGLGC